MTKSCYITNERKNQHPVEFPRREYPQLNKDCEEPGFRFLPRRQPLHDLELGRTRSNVCLSRTVLNGLPCGQLQVRIGIEIPLRGSPPRRPRNSLFLQ